MLELHSVTDEMLELGVWWWGLGRPSPNISPQICQKKEYLDEMGGTEVLVSIRSLQMGGFCLATELARETFGHSMTPLVGVAGI